MSGMTGRGPNVGNGRERVGEVMFPAGMNLRLTAVKRIENGVFRWDEPEGISVLDCCTLNSRFEEGSGFCQACAYQSVQADSGFGCLYDQVPVRFRWHADHEFSAVCTGCEGLRWGFSIGQHVRENTAYQLLNSRERLVGSGGQPTQ